MLNLPSSNHNHPHPHPARLMFLDAFVAEEPPAVDAAHAAVLEHLGFLGEAAAVERGVAEFYG